MSLLAPLFLLGALAISLPIVFHLIRRTSREHVPFSSLMFLSPSPPRMTRKSRLEHLLLLLLRCLIIALLALAFSRPFFRQPAAAAAASGKKVIILLDTSASMRREALWSDATAAALDAVQRFANDTVAVVAFDRVTRTIISFDEWAKAPPAERRALASQRLSATRPSWAGTELGLAIISAAEMLDRDSPQLQGQIVVISDFQEGARLDKLQGFTWPRDVSVTPIAVKPKHPGNAGVQLLSDDSSATSGATLKARVVNSADAKVEQFTLRWASQPTNVVRVYVAPGQSRTVSLTAPESTDRLLLEGDDTAFDNTVWYVPPVHRTVNVAYIGADAETDPQRPLFYIRRAFSDSGRDSVRVSSVPAATLASTTNAALFFVTTNLTSVESADLRRQVDQGATAVCVLRNSDTAWLNALCGIPLTAEEARGEQYAMLSEIDFTHPLFAPFADPRFSDFTKIHFWKHRALKFQPSQSARVIAGFDDGTPAIAQFTVGRGAILVFAAGWEPAQSQLALSSKFVPLLYSMLELSGALRTRPSSFQVGDSVAADTLVDESDNAALSVLLPNGKTSAVKRGERVPDLAEPGLYVVNKGESQSKAEPLAFVVNVPPEESKTAMLPLENLQKLGVPLWTHDFKAAEPDARKIAQLQAADLESRQKLWRWLIAAVLMVLMVETWIAARASRRAAVAVGT